MQAREHLTVAAIGFHPIPTALRNHRGTDDDAVFAAAGQVAIDPKPTRAGFVDEMQTSIGRAERAHDLVERLEIARDHAVVADFARGARRPRSRRQSFPCGHPALRTCYGSP